MADRTAAERLAAHLKEGVAAMRQGAWNRAVLHLRPVAHDEVLEAADDLADIRARVLTLLAQALLEDGEVGDHDEVEALLVRATALAEDARPIVNDLQERLDDARRRALEAEAHDARTRRLADADIEPWLERLTDPDRRCDLLTQKAAAVLALQGPVPAAPFAERALAIGHEAQLRSRVMAHLVMARTHPEAAKAHLDAALAMADAASEFTLVGTIARTAELLGLPLPTQQGASMPRPNPSGET